MNAVLEFSSVSLAERAPYENGLRAVSFTLEPGDLLLVQLPEGYPLSPLADVASGLVEPDEGVIRFLGKSWAEGYEADRASARGRIGRVFERAGWLSNLDIDENITLAQRYHTRRDPAEILAEAQTLARELGLGEIPAGRPAHQDRAVLLAAQWVRALVAHPRLLLLERPVRDLPDADVESFVRAILRRREQDGLAVVWLTDSHERVADSALRPTRKCAMQDGELQDWISR